MILKSVPLTYLQPQLLHSVSALNPQNMPHKGSSRSRPKVPPRKISAMEENHKTTNGRLYPKAVDEQADEVQRQAYLSRNVGR